MSYHCKRCKTEIQGNSVYCVSCYRWLCRPCPNCMKMDAKSVYRPIKKGRPLKPIDCPVCCNERWVLYDDGGKIVRTGQGRE